MSRESITKRITSLSLASFVYVVAFRLILYFFGAVGLYESFLHVIALAFTVSIPLAFATYIFYYVEDGFSNLLKPSTDYYEESYKDAQ